MRSAVSLVILILQFTSAQAGENWPQFCGPEGNGRSDARGLPPKLRSSQFRVLCTISVM